MLRPGSRRRIERAVRDARGLVRRLEIQRVIIAPHTSLGGDTLDLMRTFGATGARVSVIPALLQVVGSSVEFDDVHGVAVLGVRSFSLSRSSRMVKRMFDVLSAALGLAVAAPLLGVSALLVKLTSRGPIFFRQERVGRSGRSFELLKFRSMCVDAEERKRGARWQERGRRGLLQDRQRSAHHARWTRAPTDQSGRAPSATERAARRDESRRATATDSPGGPARRRLASPASRADSWDDGPLAGARLEPGAARRNGRDRLSLRR